MSREIDERVVQMKFEKGQFEKDIQTSIHNLDELKKGLDFKDASKGFAELDRAARNTDISALGKAAEQVQVKFGALEVFALRVMTRISDAAIDAGEKLVKSLTIDQITPGWEKYGQKTSAVQTIMAATAAQFSDTATQMDVVNTQLNKLNWFTDETSYKFVDMVDNIGKFTSYNVPLDQAVTAMQGIANWAAISGANAQSASHAMYNLAQALANNKIQLMDWKSINTANMATSEFKQTVIDVATELGTLKKTSENTWATVAKGTNVSTVAFDNTLAEGWFTGDVLMKALERYGAATEKVHEIYEELEGTITTSSIISVIDKYTAAVSNARAESEKLGLSTEESDKRVATATAEMAEQVSKKWNVSLEQATEWLKAFDDETMQFGLKAFKAGQEAKTFAEAIDSVKEAVSTKWMQSFEYIFGNYQEAKELWTNVANTLYDIFAAGGDERNEMLAEWKEEFQGTQYAADTIYAALAAVLSILTPIKAAWQAIFGKMTAKRLSEITVKIHDFVLGLVLTEESAQKIARVFRGVFSVLDIVKTVLTEVVKGGFQVLRRVLKELNIDAGEFVATLGDGLYEIRNWVKQSNAIPIIFEKIGDALVWVIKEARNFISAIEEFGPVKAILDGIHSMFTNDFQGIGGILTAIGNTFLWLWAQLRAFKMPTGLHDITNFFKEFWAAIKDIFNDVGVDLTWVDELVKNFGESVQKTLGTVNNAFITSTGVIGGAIAYLIKLFSSVDWSGVLLAGFGVATLAILWKFADALNGIAKAFQNVTGVGKAAQGAMNAIKEYFKALKANVQANALLKIAISITALAVSLGLLAKFKWDELKDGAKTLGIIGLSLAAVAGAMALLSKIGMNVSGLSTILLSFAGSIALLVFALNKIPYDKDDPNALSTRLEAIKALLARMGLVVAELTVISSLVKSSPIDWATIVAMAVGVSLLIKTMTSINEGDLPALYGATAAIIVLMGALAALSALLTHAKVIEKDLGGGIKTKTKMGGTFGTTIGLVMGLILLIQTIKMLGKMDPATVTQGIILCIPIMIALAALFKASAKAGQYASSAGKMMLFLSAGLAILIPVVKGFAAMDMGELVKGGLTITALSTLIMLPLVALSKFAGKYAAKAGLMILEIAGALALIQLVVKTLGKVDFVELTKGTAAVAVLIVAFSTVISALHGLGKASEQNVKAMTQVVIIVGMLSALVLLLTVINPLGALAVSGGLAALFVSMAVMFKQINGIQLPDEKKLFVIFAAVGVIAGIIGFMGAITNWQGALAVAGGMSAVILALASVTQILKNSATSKSLNEKLTTLFAFALGMSAVMAIVASITDAYIKAGGNVTDLLGVTTAMSELILAFGIMGKLIGKLSLPEARKLTDLVIFAGLMATVVGIIAFAVSTATRDGNGIDVAALLAFTTAMTEVMLAMGVAIRIMSGVKTDESVIGQIVALGIIITLMGGILGTIAAAMSKSGMPMTDMLIFTTGISEIVLALGIAVRIMGKTDFQMGIAQAGAMSLLIFAIGAALGAFSGMTNPDTVLPFALGMSVVILAVSAAAVILSKFQGGSMTGAIKGAVVAMVIVGLIAALMGVISSIVKDPAIFETAAEMLRYIGEGIGGFFGGIIAGFGKALIGGLPDMMNSISQGMHNLMPFFEDLKQIPGGALGLIGTLVGIVAAITAAQFISGLKMIPGLGLILSAGSITMVTDFALFGKAIRAFSDALGDDFNGENVEHAANALAALAKIEQNMGGLKGVINGLIDTVFGTDNLEAFGNRLVQLGNGLKQFSFSVAGIDNGVVKNAVSIADTLIALEKGLPKKGGVLQSFFGEVDIGQFGQRLVSFGSHLKMFAITVSSITEDSVSGAVSAGKSLVELEKMLSPFGGAVTGFLFGEKDLSAFGSRLVSFAQSLVDFSVKASEITSLEAISRARVAAGWLIELEKEIDQNGGLKGAFFGDNSFKSFGSNLSSFGSALVLFEAQVKPLDINKMHSVVEWIRDLISLKDLKFAQDDAIKAAQTILTDIRTVIDNNENSMRAKGTAIIFWVAKGMESGSSVHRRIVENTAISMANEFIAAFEAAMGIASPSVVMAEEGKWVVKGLAEGITNETSAEEAAQKKAQNLVSAFNSELSKLTRKENISNLEFQLWQLTDGKSASEVEIAQKQLELENEKLAHLAQTVGARKQAMEAIAKISGESSNEYQEAYQSYLQAQIDMLNQQKSIDETYNGSTELSGEDYYKAGIKQLQSWVEDNRAAYEFLGKSEEDLINAGYQAVFRMSSEDVARMNAYNEYLNENKEALAFMGKSWQEMQEYAAEMTGFDFNILYGNASTAVSSTAQIIEENINAYSLDLEQTLSMAAAEVIQNSAKKAGGSAKAAGAGLASNVGGGFKEKIEQMVGGGDDGEGLDLGGLFSLDKWSELWNSSGIGDWFGDQGVDLSGTFSTNFISGLTENTKPIADGLYEVIQNGISDSGILDLVKEYGGAAVEGVAEGIADEGLKQNVLDAIKNYITDPVKDIAGPNGLDINSPSKVTMEYGEAVTEGFADGISSVEKITLVENALKEIFSIIVTTMDEMPTLGLNTMQGYASGLADKNTLDNIIAIVANVSNQVKTPFIALVPTMKKLGINAMEGFKLGIIEEGQKAIAAAEEIASSVANILAFALSIESPSKVTYAIGRYVGIGLANGIRDTGSVVANSAEAMADTTISSLNYAAEAINNIINTDEDFQPVITPVLDMDQLKEQASGIPGLLNSNRSIDISSARLRVGQINAGKKVTSNQNGSADGLNQTNYSFVQNNYSPKALSRAEIYRQTNNQFSQIKEATKRR